MTRRGLYNLDNTRKGFGYGVNGAMTKYVRVPSRILHHVPTTSPSKALPHRTLLRRLQRRRQKRAHRAR